MTTKNATQALVELAKNHPGFRTALLGEIVKEADTSDFTIDPFSQHQMLRNLHGGDLIELTFSPNPLHPQQIATRMVSSDFDPSIPGVLLQGLEPEPEILADRGQGQPLLWEPGEGEPGIPVIQLKLVRTQLKLGAEDGDKATAAQVQFALDLLKAKGKSSPNKSSLENMSEVEVSKLINKMKSASDKKASEDPVVQEILEALGGQQKLASLVGARNFRFLKETVCFRWPNRVASKGTRCAITVFEDKYAIGFFAKNESGTLVRVADYKVPKDELVKTFEKQTGWFLQI